jgi:hypothetical protein
MVASSSKKNLTKIGKAQAREQFAPLIESLSTNGGVVEVTDYGKVAAVMLGYKDYLWLVAQAREPFKPKRQLAGLGVLAGDLEQASSEIAESILAAVQKSIKEL